VWVTIYNITMKDKNFDYGDFVLEYRHEKGGQLFFLRKKVTDLEVALKEANSLKDRGFHDVLLKINDRK
jgi:hypothetical protein